MQRLVTRDVDQKMMDLCEVADEWGPDETETDHARDDLDAAIRAEKIRAVLACQWGVAAALLSEGRDLPGEWVFSLIRDSDAKALIDGVCSLPTAEEIVDGVTP